MPLWHRDTGPTHRLICWHATEGLDDFIARRPVRPAETAEWNRLNVEHRRMEWIVARWLLDQAAGRPVHVEKAQTGRPFVRDWDAEISISHAFGRIGVLVGDGPVGLDIERIDDRPQRIASKFLSEDELNAWQRVEHGLTTCWCAKEAAYKYLSDPGISLRDEMTVERGPADSIHVRITGRVEPLSVTCVAMEGSMIAYIV